MTEFEHMRRRLVQRRRARKGVRMLGRRTAIPMRRGMELLLRMLLLLVRLMMLLRELMQIRMVLECLLVMRRRSMQEGRWRRAMRRGEWLWWEMRVRWRMLRRRECVPLCGCCEQMRDGGRECPFGRRLVRHGC
jgi:hypothetical protein